MYFTINNKKIPAIFGGSVDYIGSTIELSFGGSISYNTNTSKSSDILFLQLALGEGPIYRVNPNGPQDIEIDGKYIDDLIDFNTNNTKGEVFSYRSSTGTVNQVAMPSFSSEIVNRVRFSSPVVLKSGLSSDPEVEAPPATSVLFFPTNTSEGLTPIDSIRFKLNISELKSESGSVTDPTQLGIVALVHDRSETANLNSYIAGSGVIINSLVTGGMATEVEVKIPDELKSAEGYNISVLKTTEDVAEEGYVSEVEVVGFDEIRKETYSYPKTATVGYAVKATDFRSDSIPVFTTLLKGMLVEVPSNYNQPILESGEVDWRQIEVPESGEYSYSVNGFRTQEFGDQIQYTPYVNIYKGMWDGSYKLDWTENRVWIIRHILVNILKIPETFIDKYNFYAVAQYSDAVDPVTGNFVGVDGFADGSFRYKPNGYNTETYNSLIGLPAGTPVKERRFVCGVSITDNSTAWDVINSLAAGMRCILSPTGNKFRLIIDIPEALPVALFNDTNISANSFKVSGIGAEDVVTGVEVSYIDLYDHFNKTTLLLEASDVAIEDRSNKISVNALGCTRKSEALRLAKYHLLTNRELRRKISFSASYDASDLEVGDIISVSQQGTQASYGYGGIVYSNTSIGSNVYLEHITSPSMPTSFFTSNTLPLTLKVFSQDTNILDYYIVSNSSYSLSSSDRVISGNDIIRVAALSKFNRKTKVFEPFSGFNSANTISKYDLWALGECNPANFLKSDSDKLYRIDSLRFTDDFLVNISATEYNSSLIVESESNIYSISDSVSVTSQDYVTPPTPILNLKYIPAKSADGVISYNVLLSTKTDTTGYTTPTTTVVSYGSVGAVFEVDSQESE